MSKALQVGIAGYGLAGRYFHAPLLKGCGYEVSGILTNDRDRAEQARADFPDVHVVSTIDNLLAPGLDLLVVASANIVHAEQTLAGINAGIPVVVDKPMCLSFLETEMLVAASREKQVPITVFFNRRWDSDALTVKKVLREGLLGEVFRVDSRFERYRPSVATASWREKYTADEGGGLLLDLQPHLISTMIDWFGPAKLRYASVRAIRGGSDDDSLLVLEHDSGVDSYLSASAIIGAPGPRLRVNGSKGTLIIDDLDPQESLLRAGHFPAGGQWDVPTASRAFIHRGDEIVEIEGENGNYATFYQIVKGAIAGNHPWPVDLQDALDVASIVDQARAISIR